MKLLPKIGSTLISAGACLLLTANAKTPNTEKIKEDKITSNKRPNLLFVLPDEYRQTSMGIWSDKNYAKYLPFVGDPVHTPAIDKFAKEGVIFTNAYSMTPVCSPYRAMLMSGMYPAHNNVGHANCYQGRAAGLKTDITAFTNVIANANYDTAYVGKTHWLKTEPLFDKDGNYVGSTQAPGGFYTNPYDTFIPAGRGRFGNKVWFQFVADDHKNAHVYSSEPSWIDGKKDGEVHRPNRFTPEREAEVIVDYINNKDNIRDKSKPFSLFWSPNPPHPPFDKLTDCDEKIYEQYYKDKKLDELLTHPNTKPIPDREVETIAPVYFSNVTAIDREFGKIMAALEASGEADNTIVIFTSDHGEMLSSHGLIGKNVIYPEAFLVPLIIKFPKKMQHRMEDLKISPIDIMPTVLGLMGLGDSIPKTVEGVNYADAILTGDFSKTPKPEAALFLRDKEKGVRTNLYTYKVDNKGEVMLFDNVKDPYCKTNLALDAISKEALDKLQFELGQGLEKADDPWAKKKLHSNLIKYSK